MARVTVLFYADTWNGVQKVSADHRWFVLTEFDVVRTVFLHPGGWD